MSDEPHAEGTQRTSTRPYRVDFTSGSFTPRYSDAPQNSVAAIFRKEWRLPIASCCLTTLGETFEHSSRASKVVRCCVISEHRRDWLLAGPRKDRMMSRYSLLVVDDDEYQLDTFSRWFGRRGFEVTAVNDSDQALAAIHDHRFDAAVIDVWIPGMNGLDLLERLKQQSCMPVLVLSGESDPSVRNEAIERGALQYLLKPTPLLKVDKILSEALTSTRAPNVAAKPADIEAINKSVAMAQSLYRDVAVLKCATRLRTRVSH